MRALAAFAPSPTNTCEIQRCRVLQWSRRRLRNSPCWVTCSWKRSAGSARFISQSRLYMQSRKPACETGPAEASHPALAQA